MNRPDGSGSGLPASAADAALMRRALAQAALAGEAGEVPVGAVVLDAAGEIVAETHNRTRELSDPTAHAELLAIRAAGEKLGDWRLEGHTLYATLEPCAMCTGAAVLARVPRLVFGAHDPKAGMCGSVGDLARHAALNHRIDVVGGVLEAPCGEILSTFFRERRG